MALYAVSLHNKDYNGACLSKASVVKLSSTFYNLHWAVNMLCTNRNVSVGENFETLATNLFSNMAYKSSVSFTSESSKLIKKMAI